MTEADNNHEFWGKQRELYVDADREGARSFDKAILATASGAFAITIAFLREVAPEVNLCMIPLLAVSWLMFAASITSTLCSFLASQRACKAYIRECDRLMATPGAEPQTEDLFVGHLVEALNYLAIAFLLFGFLFWMMFVMASLILEKI